MPNNNIQYLIDVAGRTDYMAGKVKIDEYVTHKRTLSDLWEGFHDMHVSTTVV